MLHTYTYVSDVMRNAYGFTYVCTAISNSRSVGRSVGRSVRKHENLLELFGDGSAEAAP